jgi:hypothetical protein
LLELPPKPLLEPPPELPQRIPNRQPPLDPLELPGRPPELLPELDPPPLLEPPPDEQAPLWHVSPMVVQSWHAAPPFPHVVSSPLVLQLPVISQHPAQLGSQLPALGGVLPEAPSTTGPTLAPSAAP